MHDRIKWVFGWNADPPELRALTMDAVLAPWPRVRALLSDARPDDDRIDGVLDVLEGVLERLEKLERKETPRAH